jgi:hypothetical protein
MTLTLKYVVAAILLMLSLAALSPDQIAEAQKLAREWKPNTQSPSR